MKKINVILLGLVLLGIPTVKSIQATTYRNVGLKDLATLSKSSGSLGFKGKVIQIQDSKDYQKVSFEVQEVLRGVAPSQNTLTLNFRKPVKLHVQGWAQQKPPAFTKDEESVLFVTRNIKGDDFFIGGEDQARFYVKKTGTRSVIWNNLGNRNLVDTQSSNTLMRSIVSDMQSRNEGSIDYQDFKKLLDQSEE